MWSRLETLPRARKSAPMSEMAAGAPSFGRATVDLRKRGSQYQQMEQAVFGKRSPAERANVDFAEAKVVGRAFTQRFLTTGKAYSSTPE